MGILVSREYVRKLRHGDSFRDWLVRVQGHRIKNSKCDVREFKVRPASHRVCRYEFEGEGFSVIAKFFEKPNGKIRKYDFKGAMFNEYQKLKGLKKQSIFPAHCSKHAFRLRACDRIYSGKPFPCYLKNEKDLDEKLKATAHLLGKLRQYTKRNY